MSDVNPSDFLYAENEELKLPYGEAMLRRLVCANGNTVAGDLSVFLEECVGLRLMILRDRANASVEVAFERGKTDSESLSSHFNVAFAHV